MPNVTNKNRGPEQMFNIRVIRPFVSFVFDLFFNPTIIAIH